jgi:hypothetical protein
MCASVSKTKTLLSKDEIVEMLKISPEAYDEFEKAYQNIALSNVSDNFFNVNAKQAATEKEGITVNGNADVDKKLDDIINRIVDELLSKTYLYIYDGTTRGTIENNVEYKNKVTNQEILEIPEELRPQLTGSLMQIDVDANPSTALLMNYKGYLNAKDEKSKRQWYHMFRQGLDILDYDQIMYEIIGTNPNSMGYWFPALVEAVKQQDFFKVPKTKILKVPMPILQLTRLGYENLTRTTLDIVDKYCYKVFNLQQDEEYFIKTGTYSSKFDFRNAYVHEAKEVRELGEYLLYIHYQANQMASPLCQPCIYGVSTTNEWVVREFIQDKENSPCIYKGLPLHTEYRVFIDCDTCEILGCSPYWRPDVMKKRFEEERDIHDVHDYVVFEKCVDTLTSRYDYSIENIKEHIKTMLPNLNLTGQWSLDIMQNDDDFWIIDMAQASNSALVDCVPKNLLKPVEENWLPDNLFEKNI